ncbi:MAG: hypothetical protein ACJ8DZ_02505 [Allosphingosinicella sp.]
MRKAVYLAAAAGLTALAPLAGCAPTPAPRVAPPPPREAPPPLPPAPPVTPDWRDLPLSPGDWTYAEEAGGPRAAFGGALFELRCDASGHAVKLSRIGAGQGTMVLTTSFGARRLALGAGGVATVPASDPLLDQLAFSRGRFTVEVEGLDRLVIPAWPEPARLIEECRG